jgi:hypothetical protein
MGKSYSIWPSLQNCDSSLTLVYIWNQKYQPNNRDNCGMEGRRKLKKNDPSDMGHK